MKYDLDTANNKLMEPATKPCQVSLGEPQKGIQEATFTDYNGALLDTHSILAGEAVPSLMDVYRIGAVDYVVMAILTPEP